MLKLLNTGTKSGVRGLPRENFDFSDQNYVQFKTFEGQKKEDNKYPQC